MSKMSGPNMKFIKILILALTLTPILLKAENITAFVFSQNLESKQEIYHIQTLLENTLKQNKHYSFVNLDSLLGSTMSIDAHRKIKKAQKAFELGLQNYKLLDLNEAQKIFSSALKLYNQSLSYLPSLEQLAQTNLFLGATEHLLGNNKQAKKRYLEAHALSNHLLTQYNSKQLGKSQEKFFEQATSELKKSKRKLGLREVAISSDPIFSGISLNGKFQGSVPVLKQKLPHGTHVLRAAFPGYSNHAKSIKISNNSSPNIYITLEPTPKFRKYELLTEKLLYNVGQPEINAATELNTDNAIWVALSLSQNALTAHANFSNSTSKTMRKPKASIFRVFLIDTPTFDTEFKSWINQIIKDNLPDTKKPHALHKNWHPEE